MKWMNLISAANCFMVATWTDCPWLALIGFGNLAAWALMQGFEVYDFLAKNRRRSD